MPHHRAGDQPERDGLRARHLPERVRRRSSCAPGSHADVVRAGAASRRGTLDLAGISDDAARGDRRRSSRRTSRAPPAFPSDTYFGGKALYRAATLVVLGEQLGADDVVADLRGHAPSTRCASGPSRTGAPRATPAASCTTRPRARRSSAHPVLRVGRVQRPPLPLRLPPGRGGPARARTTRTLADELAPVMNLLAQDIAAALPSDELPQLRTFDPYAGHSWASGTSPFADGNNQESSSEAVTAWNGLGLWAQASDQDGARDAGHLARVDRGADRPRRTGRRRTSSDPCTRASSTRWSR